MIDFTYHETTDLDNTFGVDAEHYEQDGRHFIIRMDGPEAFELMRDPSSGRLQVHPGEGFDWDAAEAFRGEPFPEDV